MVQERGTQNSLERVSDDISRMRTRLKSLESAEADTAMLTEESGHAGLVSPAGPLVSPTSKLVHAVSETVDIKDEVFVTLKAKLAALKDKKMEWCVVVLSYCVTCRIFTQFY